MERDNLGQYAKGHIGLKGSANGMWLEKPTYAAVHAWIRKEFGSADHCENSKCEGKETEYEWSNKSGKYLRDRKDWQQLCVPCHRKFDNHIFFHLNHKGSKNPSAKLTEQDIVTIRELVLHGTSKKEVRQRFGISPVTCWRILTGNTWKHLKLS